MANWKNPAYPDADKTIAIDFDGVIHKNSKGYHDGTVYDDPVDGAVDAIKELSKRYILIIHTCKARQDRPLVNGATGTAMIWDWLKRYGINECISAVTATKPSAFLYIDDKATCFLRWDLLMEEIV